MLLTLLTWFTLFTWLTLLTWFTLLTNCLLNSSCAGGTDVAEIANMGYVVDRVEGAD